jgi:ribosomal protein L11 methyltransferase
LTFYPALQIDGFRSDVILAIVDECAPRAVDGDECGATLRVFFAAAASRDAAHAALTAAGIPAARIEVDDEDWARRSQENLEPITVGRITVVSHQSPVVSAQSSVISPEPPDPSPQIVIVIPPSMGFGTGHHATTRLCLAALQTIDLSDSVVLDVGTGSGVLAIAAARLGAARVLGFDSDEDAVQAARESIALNPDACGVALAVIDLMSAPLPRAGVVTANLTGALLIRAAARLVESVRPGGTLIVSGLLAEERQAVHAAFSLMDVVWESEEDGWVGLALRAGH